MENPMRLFNHGIIAYVPHPTDPDKISIIHFCGFEREPEKEEFETLYAELKTDPEFGLMDVDFDLTLAPQAVVDHFRSVAEAENFGQENPEQSGE